MNIGIREVRTVDLERVMEALGYQPASRSGGSLEYHLPDGRKLGVSPQPKAARSGRLGMFQCWNGEALPGRAGGAGAVNLVMAVTGQTLNEALLWLSRTFYYEGRAPAALTTSPRTPQGPPEAQKRHSLPERHEEGMENLRCYLMTQRRLPSSIVDSVLSEGLVYPHIHRFGAAGEKSFTNAVFLMRDDVMQTPTGSLIRGCYDGQNARKSSLPLDPNNSATAFWVGPPLAAAERIVLTEAPIECLSYLALNPTRGIHCRTYGGNRWRLVSSILPQLVGRKLVCAFNNDKAGDAAAAELARLCVESGVVFLADKPELKDWNADLKRRELLQRSEARRHRRVRDGKTGA